MPIIEPPSDSQQLLQGDVLQGVRLYATGRSWADDGGTSRQSSHKFCLVLSRPCVAQHKKTVIVAAIEKYDDKVPKDVDSFTKVCAFLTAMRDGVGSPDRFYLGQLPGKQGRFCARLDALHCIEVPSEQQELSPFLRKRRIGTLNIDFVRDLHLRVFAAFASLGFNEESWLPDDDLNWLVKIAEQEVKEAELELQKARAEKAGRDAEGKQYAEGKIRQLEARVASLQNQIQPYANEKSLREQDHR